MEKKEYESIKKKILKIYNLAEHGVGGEAVNAKNLLNLWLSKYGLSLETILEEENEKHWYEFKGANQKHYRQLLFNCYAKVTNRHEVTYKHKRGTKKKIWLELTAYQYAELTTMFEWHKDQLDKELARIKDEATSAFIQKHRLYSDTETDGDQPPLTPEEIKRLLRILEMANNMEDVTFAKMLARHNPKP